MSDTTENEETQESSESSRAPSPPPVPIRTMLEEIVRDVVSMPDAVRIDESERDEDGDRFTLYEINVDPSDLGKVIGKNGRTARALRAMVNALAARSRVQAEMEIVEPEGSRPPARDARDDAGGDDASDDGDDDGADDETADDGEEETGGDDDSRDD